MLVEIQHRLMCGSASIAQVWWQAKYGRSDDEICWLDYHQPRGMPTFLTLDYVRSGKQAGFKSFVGACHVLDEIARLRGATAIVAHVSNGNLSDRFMQRMGWEEHMHGWSGRHWIRRFYDGYPKPTLHRYVPGATAPESQPAHAISRRHPEVVAMQGTADQFTFTQSSSLSLASTE